MSKKTDCIPYCDPKKIPLEVELQPMLNITVDPLYVHVKNNICKPSNNYCYKYDTDSDTSSVSSSSTSSSSKKCYRKYKKYYKGKKYEKCYDKKTLQIKCKKCFEKYKKNEEKCCRQKYK